MIKVSQEIFELCPDLRLGILKARISMSAKSDALWAEMENALASINIDRSSIKENQNIEGARKAYKKFGKDPSRYRLSAEALLRRIVSGKGIYQISNGVDIVNYLSFSSGFSIGSYDAKKINGAITLRLGLEEEPYETIGRGQINIHRLPMLCDTEGPFGNPSSDSKRTMMDLGTTEILFVIFDFNGQGDLDKSISEAKRLLEKFAGGSEFKHQYLLAKNHLV